MKEREDLIGPWLCELDSDCSFLSGGEERGWYVAYFATAASLPGAYFSLTVPFTIIGPFRAMNRFRRLNSLAGPTSSRSSRKLPESSAMNQIGKRQICALLP